jgi:co-chaperonin GroES (HSP10)
MTRAKRDVQVIPPDKYLFVDNADVKRRLNAEMQDDLSEIGMGHGIVPIEYKVVIRPVEETGVIKLKGGFELLKPDTTKERDQHAAIEGEIVATSPFAFSYEEWPDGARKPRVGDVAIFARYSGNTIKGNDGVDYRVMNDKDIIAVRRVAK